MEEEETFESYWHGWIDDARRGHPQAARYLIQDLIATLEGKALVFRGTNDPEVRAYLVEVLRAALDAPADGVSNALRITQPAAPRERGAYYRTIREHFLAWYKRTLEKRGLDPTNPKHRVPANEFQDWVEDHYEDLDRWWEGPENLQPTLLNDTLLRWAREARPQWVSDKESRWMFGNLIDKK